MSGDDPERPAPLAGLVDEALSQICDRLSDLYFALYEERTVDARVALAGNVLAFVFDGGLAPADEWLLLSGRGERVREFRQSFFEVVSDDMVRVVGDLTGVPVTYSFFDFDPTTRTTLSIFVLDAGAAGADIAARMQAKDDEVRRDSAAVEGTWRTGDSTSE